MAGLPPVDSLNMWPSISSGNGSITPRTEIFMTPLNDTAGHGGDAAIIIGWLMVQFFFLFLLLKLLKTLLCEIHAFALICEFGWCVPLCVQVSTN